MILIDVNVLVYGFREDAPDHKRYFACGEPPYEGLVTRWMCGRWRAIGKYSSSFVRHRRHREIWFPDAYPAALAIESGSEWITTDRDSSRFAGLRWRHSLKLNQT